MRLKLRRLLDDEQSLWAKGEMWSDAELDLALDAAQLAFVRVAYLKKYWHLIGGLHVEASGSSPMAVPSDYMMYSSAVVESPITGTFWPAALRTGYAGKIFSDDPERATAFIRSATVEFRRGTTSVNGKLYYYRRPTKISGGSNHTEFTDQCYDAMLYHAAAILQQKDWGQCQRALKNMQAVLAAMTGEPAGMFPQNISQNGEA